MDLDWINFEKELKTLAGKIDYKADIIVGIVRGGIIPARMLSSILNVREMHCLTVKKCGDRRMVSTKIINDLPSRKILLVEDMLETGRSIVIAKNYLESKGAQVQTACLYTTPQSEIIPDFYLRQIKEQVHFPWE